MECTNFKGPDAKKTNFRHTYKQYYIATSMNPRSKILPMQFGETVQEHERFRKRKTTLII